MDPITQQTTLAAAGGKKDPVYVDDVFNTDLWAGNETNRSITNGIDLTEGGMVWLKARTIGHDHLIFDTERGANYRLKPNTTDSSASATNRLTAFNNDGFTLGTDSDINQNNQNVVSWTFRKAPGFFDVVTYTGNGVAGRSVAHNLGSKPGMILVKRTDGTADWIVYHRSIGYEGFLILNSTNEEYQYSNRWHAEPDANNFYVGSGYNLNNNNETYVAYVFAHDDAQFGTDEDESIIKFGTYTGTGAANNTVNLGFEPQWVMLKSTSSGNAQPWFLLDNMRGAPSGSADAYIFANASDAEATAEIITFNPTGFAIEATGAGTNGSGQNYIYMAIRRPNKPPSAATEVFAIDTNTGSPPNYVSGFPVDLAINRDGVNSGGDVTVFSRLMGQKRLKTNSSEAEGNAFTAAAMDYNNGYARGTGSANSENYSWMFKRAPGFFDVVTYTGTGSATTINHNLTVEPELIMVKCRSHSENWGVYSSALGPTKYLRINTTAAANTSNIFWNDTAPTSSVFTVYPYDGVNGSGKTYLALLFATLPGISKVGSYTGTGSALNIDCGFTNGARFVLIKRTDSSGSWYVWDTTRGIVSGNDPYLLLNRDNNGTDAQVTNTDYIDPLNAGFTVTSSAPAALNVSGGTYLFLAIA